MGDFCKNVPILCLFGICGRSPKCKQAVEQNGNEKITLSLQHWKESWIQLYSTIGMKLHAGLNTRNFHLYCQPSYSSVVNIGGGVNTAKKSFKTLADIRLVWGNLWILRQSPTERSLSSRPGPCELTIPRWLAQRIGPIQMADYSQTFNCYGLGHWYTPSASNGRSQSPQ